MAGDPIGRLRGDETSVAQARIVVGAGGVTLQVIEGTNVQSGYYRTLNDSKVYDVPWPYDVYRQNGKKASYDSLTIPEFVQGYCAIVVIIRQWLIRQWIIRQWLSYSDHRWERN